MPESQGNEPFILGLDLGAESLGWAILPCRERQRSRTPEPVAITRAGGHGFDAAVEGDFESGKDESRAKARRDARQPRRQHWRRAWRRQKLLRILQRHDLIPPAPIDSPEAIHKLILELDKSLRSKHVIAGDRVSAHLLPYLVRAKGLDNELEPYELGRALYHLAQRRGFESNRKAKKSDEDEGVVKTGISELQSAMDAARCKTLGQYFASLDPEEERIRRRWTSRQMYKSEFELLWTAQAVHHAVLTDELKQRVHHAIFHQRSLKSQSHLIGECELVPGHKRAPLALRVAQRFRMLQKVNDLAADLPDGTRRELTPRERETLIAALGAQGDMKFTTMRGKKCLNLPKGTTFNLEEGGEKKMPGLRTDAKLGKIFGDRWNALTETHKDQIVEDVLTFEKADALARRAKGVWGLDDEPAHELAELTLEEGHSSHCRRALHVLVERMEDGTPYATARKEAFPESFEATDPVDALPPVLESIKSLRNPAVCRALTELRKLVNAIIRKYGKPELIRLELATELKRPRKLRQEISKRNRQNQVSRDNAKKKILHELGRSDPKPVDIQRVLLAEECNWICPYTGKPINMRTLLGEQPQFDIEHILPFARSMDNTFVNKTLCYHEENRTRKRNLTPFEAYGRDEKRWPEILQRVKRFQGEAARAKLRRFQMEEIPEGFTERQLQDTRYASRLAADYLGLLYGGRVDAEGKLRVQVSAGGVTHHLRNEWMLNSILGDGGQKTRDDHRHHAVDAIAIAFAGPATVKQLADAAGSARQHRRRLFAPLPFPWAEFLDDVRKAIQNINVSRRADRKIAGPLHEESIYSKAHHAPDKHGKPVDCRHIRKPLASMSPAEIDRIVDPVIRQRVKDKLAQVGGDPKKAFAVPENHPVLVTRDGREIPIHKARIRKTQKVISVGQRARQRYVAPGSNHHMAIVAQLDKDGNDKTWKGHLVSRFEAAQRARRGESVVQRQWPKGHEFRFTLAPGEMFTLQGEAGPTGPFVVRSISEGRVEFVSANDARRKADIKAAKEWIVRTPNTLRERGCRKVTVSYLGEIRPAND